MNTLVPSTHENSERNQHLDDPYTTTQIEVDDQKYQQEFWSANKPRQITNEQDDTNENDMSCYFPVNHEQKPLTAVANKKRDKKTRSVYEDFEQDSREIMPTHEGHSAISASSPNKEKKLKGQSSLFQTLAKSLEEAYKKKYAEEK